LTITGAVISVCRTQFKEIGAVLFQQATLCKVGGISARGEDDWPVFFVRFPVRFVFNANGLVTISYHFGDTGLLQDGSPVGSVLGNVLESLHESVCDNHTREHFLSAVSTGLRMSAEPRDERQIEVEDILQPFDGGGRLVGQDLDKFGASKITGGFEGVVIELLDAVLDVEGDLGACQSTIDAGRGLGRVAA
jgi:hypothetical protein